MTWKTGKTVVDSIVRGHHIIWTPFLREVLQAEMEEGNEEDRYAVAILKDGWHYHWPCPWQLLQNILFLRHGGSIECKITGHRKFGIGLEVLCTYTVWKAKVCQETGKASDEGRQR